MAAPYNEKATLPSGGKLPAEVAASSEGMAGWKLTRHALLDSSNSEAQRCVAAGCCDKTIILVDRQSAGKGRLQRVWESPGPEGLWASLILMVALPPEQLAQSTLVLAAAVREAVEHSTGVRLESKWPNDLMSGGRKCCGLLVEAGLTHDAPGQTPHTPPLVPLILGIGLNINQTAESFPPSLRGIATSLRLLSGVEHCRMRILRELAARVASWFALWTAQGFAPVRKAWLAGNCTMGRELMLPDGYGWTRGMAHDLAPDGALLVRTDAGNILRIDSGEIIFRNAPGAASGVGRAG